MSELKTSIPNLVLVRPVPERDAPFAFGWFNSINGKDTLLKMGNAPQDINTSSLEKEKATIISFLALEKSGKQKTWMMRLEEKTIGAAWIDLVDNHGVKAPSVHLMIGDVDCRGKGVGTATMQSIINFLKESGYEIVYSRHLVSNIAVTALCKSIGFVTDDKPYTDSNGLEWQNIKLSF